MMHEQSTMMNISDFNTPVNDDWGLLTKSIDQIMINTKAIYACMVVVIFLLIFMFLIRLGHSIFQLKVKDSLPPLTKVVVKKMPERKSSSSSKSKKSEKEDSSVVTKNYPSKMKKIEFHIDEREKTLERSKETSKLSKEKPVQLGQPLDYFVTTTSQPTTTSEWTIIDSTQSTQTPVIPNDIKTAPTQESPCSISFAPRGTKDPVYLAHPFFGAGMDTQQKPVELDQKVPPGQVMVTMTPKTLNKKTIEDMDFE